MKKYGNVGMMGFATFLGLASTASAQGLVASQGVLVATEGDPIPDANGVPIPNFTFGGSGSLGNNCVIAPDGNVFFMGRMLDSGGSTTASNDRGLFRGTSRADLRMITRGEAQAPTLSTGVTFRTASQFGTSIGSTVRLTPSGQLLWGAQFFDTLGTAVPPVVSSNDEALFGGWAGYQGILVRQGDAAPGTVGAIFAQALASPSLTAQGLNREGRLYTSATLQGGDTTTTAGMNNQSGIWSGLPGALEMVARKSNPVSGLPGTYAIDTTATLVNFAQMNDAGQLIYDLALSTTQGTSPAVLANDRVVMVHTPGAGSTKLVREGEVAPGTGGATFNALTGEAWAPVVSVNAWTRNAQTVFVSELRGGDVVGTTNERAMFLGGTSGLTQVARKGQPAAGTDGNFSAFNTSASGSNPILNASGQICFPATIAGGTVVAANDTGIWAGTPGALNLVVREGAVMPGTGGSLAGNFSTAAALYYNDLGQVLFNVSLAGGTIIGNSLWAWDPIGGLYPMVLNGDQVQIATGVFRTVNSFGAVGNANGDGAGLVFGHDGAVGLRLGFTGSLNAIMTARVPHPCIAPTITAQPINVSGVCVGSEAHFSVSVAHSTAVTYQWSRNGIPLVNGGNISGADALALTIDPALVADAGSYECFVTTTCGTATSSPATLAIDATDTDGDGTADCNDGCPSDPLKTAPGVCGCGVADADTDGDTVLDCLDGCPNDPLKTAPGVCGCGIADTDVDFDGVLDCQDGCPNDPDKIEPGACGCGVSDNDSDLDGTADCIDGCPSDPLKTAPGVCGCGISDADTDGDTVADCVDGCPLDPFKTAPGICGCGVTDVDSDGDTVADCIDGCPTDPLKSEPGICGCNVSDADSDGDTVADCVDGCPSDPSKTSPGICGCGVADTDSDGDSVADCIDGCPADPLKTAPGQCGCGVVDVDTDGDLVADCIDNCDTISNAGQADLDGDAVGDACDNCANVSNPAQGDCDGDTIGDACEIFYGVPDCNLNGIPDTCDIANATSADLNANTVPDECETNGGTPYCFGYAACPCGNNSVAGSGQGCANSTGLGAMLLGSGSSSIGADGLTLTVSNLPIPSGGSGNALFFQGDAHTDVPFQDGRRCVSGSQIRLGVVSHNGGSANFPQVGGLPIGTVGAISGPSARYYQVWYRNNAGPCGTGSSVSNGLAVIWTL